MDRTASWGRPDVLSAVGADPRGLGGCAQAAFAVGGERGRALAERCSGPDRLDDRRHGMGDHLG